MTSRLVLPFSDVGDGIHPADGALLYFFEAGTSDPKDTYADQNLTIPNTNPVVSDSNGLFGDIWINGNYKIRLENKNNDQIWEADPVLDGLDGSNLTIIINGLQRNLQSYLENKEIPDYASLIALDPVMGTSIADGDVCSITNTGVAGEGVFRNVPAHGLTSVSGVVVVINADWYWERNDQSLLVDYFGAMGDNNPASASQNVAAINTAIEYAFSQAVAPSVYFGGGNYYINSAIDHTGTGNYVDLIGEGRRNTIITATGSSFVSMLEMAQSGDVAIHTMIRDISFNANSVADQCIDAAYMRYWTLTNCELRNAVLQCITCGNWLGRILNNRFNGSPIGVLIDGEAGAPSSQNNFVVRDNDFNTCPIGLKVEDYSNDIQIETNSFDLCEDVGLWINKGGRNIDIRGNYFERAGYNGTTNGSVTIPLSASTDESIGASIIISHDYTATTSSTWEGVIQDNFFANCNTDRLIALYNVKGGSISNNPHHNGSGQSDALVDIRAVGCSTSLCYKLFVQGFYDSSVVGKLVALNGDDPEVNQSNIVIDNQPLASLGVPKFFSNNPTLSGWAGGTTINSLSYGGFEELEFDVVADGGSIDRVFSVDFTTLTDHPLLGRYIRVHYSTKGTSTSTGVRCRIIVSGVTILDIQRSSSTYTEAGRGMVVEIPDTATSFEIRLDGLSSVNNSKMIGFCVCDAAFDISQIPIDTLV